MIRLPIGRSQNDGVGALYCCNCETTIRVGVRASPSSATARRAPAWRLPTGDVPSMAHRLVYVRRRPRSYHRDGLRRVLGRYQRGVAEVRHGVVEGRPPGRNAVGTVERRDVVAGYGRHRDNLDRCLGRVVRGVGRASLVEHVERVVATVSRHEHDHKVKVASHRCRPVAGSTDTPRRSPLGRCRCRSRSHRR